MPSERLRSVIRRRLAAEVGRIDKDAPRRVALCYPSPYSVGMSSLGYQRVYRLLQERPGVVAERVFLEDEGDRPGARLEAPVSYESQRPLSDFPVLAFSVAYENELAGLARMLEAAGIEPLRRNRSHGPLIVAGGPITFSNPLPLGAFVDAIVMGEAEQVFPELVEVAFEDPDPAALARVAHVYVPAVHGEQLPSLAACDDALLPAFSAIRTPHTELSDMFLVETERGCSRGCTYCVMRRTTNGGMRIVPEDVVLDVIPRDATRVGLVGAAVSDHPRIVSILRTLAERGTHVGLSSLRPDRLSDELVGALSAVGYRTLTTALDGPSQRMRALIERRGREEHYRSAAARARAHGMDRLKLYLMIGLPGETDADIDECVEFVTELSRTVPIALGIAPFCSKRNTPLDRMPYAGIRTVRDRLERLRRGLRGRADVRATSAKWAWVEYVLAQGGPVEAEALLSAVRAGGRFSDYKRAFEALGHRADGAGYAEAVPEPGPEWRGRRRLPVAPPAS